MKKQYFEHKITDLKWKVERVKIHFLKQNFRISYLEIEQIQTQISELRNEIKQYTCSFESRYEPNLVELKQECTTQLDKLSLDLNKLVNQEDGFNYGNKSFAEILSPLVTLFIGLLPIAAFFNALILYYYLNHLGLINVFPLVVYDIGLIPIVAFSIVLMIFFSFGFAIEFPNKKFRYWKLLGIFIVVYFFSLLGFYLISENWKIGGIAGLLWAALVVLFSWLRNKINEFKNFRDVKWIHSILFIVFFIVIWWVLWFSSIMKTQHEQPLSQVFVSSRITEPDTDTKIFKLNINFSKNLNENEKMKLAQMFRDKREKNKVEIHSAICQSNDDYLIGKLMIKTKNIHVLCPVGKELSEHQTIGKFCYQFSAGGAFGDDLIDVTAICQVPTK
ncbi:cation:proton antiporter family protein [Alysiella filiformis]|uniref:Uncharacterized protein n=1 Tax=Alysiella filiformis DSM 16848 TaxID=1120981 RepID=A0A286E5S7_9NEIS|nr:hypothetical protein [Alysiella filiformis]QMT30338.1 hypothetical protein H3L97_06090 [Alysiella filiformis]UBQ56686.1 hypothetical protein JF568_02600 [Alysiella filiformis DSM 16848]SOD66252.1 hypothetical protein SAMN02746062_00561 [Alysiella filiformis DSM 16848]